TIKKLVPDAEESISYSIPTIKQNDVSLVHFAGFKNHIGFYATPTGHEEFKEELANYKQGKGSVQFPLDHPIPYDLIKKIVKFRVKENTQLKTSIMARINPHINFHGNAEEAFTFYKSVFGGEFETIVRFKDLSSPEFPIAEKEANKIMHITLPIGKNVLMANDVPEKM